MAIKRVSLGIIKAPNDSSKVPMANLFKKRKELPRIVFDLETLDVTTTAVVLSLGITTFKITDNDNFMDLVDRGTNLIFDIEKQKAKGATTSKDTIQWWAEQSIDAQHGLMNGTDDPANLYQLLREGLGIQMTRTFWYCRGPHFDAAILQNMCNNFGLQTPWKFAWMRDTRTWFDFYPDFVFHNKRPEGFIYHNSLHDAALEAYNMQLCWKQYHKTDHLNSDQAAQKKLDAQLNA